MRNVVYILTFLLTVCRAAVNGPRNSCENNNYLCTYDLYGPMRNAFDASRYITWGSGGGVGAGNLEFCWPL